MGLPGLRRLDHIGVTVPDLEEATRFLVDVLGCEYLYSLGPFHDDGDWMSEHLGVHPRATVPENRFFRCGGQTVFEVFQYTAPDQRTSVPKNSDVGGHHIALYVDDLDTAVDYLRSQGVTVLGDPTASKGHNEGQRWVYFLAPWGLQLELVSYPNGKAFDRQQQTGSEAIMTSGSPTATPAAVSAPASQRVADYLRDAILGGEIGPGQRVRQEEVAERFGASRLPVREALRMLEAEGLIEHETNKGARVPRLDMHEVDVIYQMRERLEPLALSESIPHLTEDDLHRLDHIQSQIETNSDVGRFLELGPRVPSAHLLRVPHRPADARWSRGCGTRPSTTGGPSSPAAGRAGCG